MIYLRTTLTVNRGTNNIIKLGKDSSEKDDTTGAFYEFPCKNRRYKVNYVGQTKRTLQERVFEHVTDKKI